VGASARRRFLIASAVILVSPRVGRAQPQSRPVRVAVLEHGSRGATEARWREFRKRLRELGWIEGKNLVVDARFSQGVRERLPSLAEELVALRPDVIAVTTTPATRAAMHATSSIPIVFITGDPVGAGLVSNLARPGGNATGQSIMSADVSAKWMELLTEIVPGARKFAFLGQAGNRTTVAVFRAMQAAAEARNFSARMLEATQPNEVDRAFELMAKEKYDAFIVSSEPALLRHRRKIVALAARDRLPGVYARPEYVASGGLLSYSPDRITMFRVMAEQVHRVVQGDSPGELPVQQPTKFDLTINLGTAKALGIAIPQSILLRADQVLD